MPIDDLPASLWRENELLELIGRHETPQLEFKETLTLGSEGQNSEVEHDVQGLANAGGGHVIYGIAEIEQADDSKVASALVPLADGGLYEQLNNVLDGRGDPKVPFDLHRITSNDGGFFLVVEVYGRRRPHMANNFSYYIRRNLLVRRMTEREVSDAYSDRFARERLAAEPAQGQVGDDVEARVHHGLTPAELALYREETGRPEQPGWLSVVAYPDPLRPNLLDPVNLQPWDFHGIPMEDRWRDIEPPLMHFRFERTLAGFRAQLPPRDDAYPRYLFQFYPDGLLEYGFLLESRAEAQDPAAAPRIPTQAIAFYTRDNLLLFARILKLVGYEGRVRAFARLNHVAGYALAINPARMSAFDMRLIQDDAIESQAWVGPVDKLESEGSAVVARDISERLFVAANAGRPHFFDAEGAYTG